MHEPIRVVQIIKTLNIGGAERFGIELAKALEKRRFHVEVYVYFQDGSEVEKDWLARLGEANIPSTFLTAWKGNDQMASYLDGLRTMARLLRDRPADILHSHFQLGTLSALTCRRIGLARRVVRTAHNHPRKEWSPGLYGAIRHQLISKWVYPLCLDAEVAVSSAITDELRKHPGARLAKKPILTIFNAISPEILIDQAGARDRSDDTIPFVIGSIGRLTEQKGYWCLIRALPAVIAANPGVQIWLIGEGEQKEWLEKVASQLKLDTHIRFFGKRTDALDLLRQMDLFVLPSFWEGLPTVLMESAASNVPIIATDIPGNNEIVEKDVSGWLVPPGDPDALAAAILEAIGRPDLRAERARQARKGLGRFLIASVAEQYADLYQRLLGSSR
jgi:glycosyltransferase involved in cell wall biosynthesis